MQKFTNTIKLISFSAIPDKIFFKNFWDKNHIKIKKIINNKSIKMHTILRSPHGDKTARDQIKIESYHKLFIFNTHINWFFYYSLLKNKNLTDFYLESTQSFTQKVKLIQN